MARTEVCVTVTAPTLAELRRKRDEVQGADLVELRLDSVSDPDAAGALAGRRTRVVVTCRAAWEGGSFRGSEEARLALLRDALALGAEYVDIEWKADARTLMRGTGGRGIIISSHDYEGVPADLDARVQAMRATGAEVVKLAVRTRTLGDTLRLFDLGPRAATHGKVALIGMGDAGLATRVLAARMGACWTYAGGEHAAGQIPLEQLIDEYGFRNIGPATSLYGLAGRPVEHSVSPAMHNAAFRALQLDAVYLPCAAADVDDFVRFARAMGVRGASVTIPFKVSMFDRVDEADFLSRRIGAINTVRVEDGRWLGRNTDADGFLAPLEGRVTLKGLRASVLGAGGASRAVVVALGSAGATVCVHARKPAQARAVAELAGAAVGDWPPVSGSWDLLVNCTPVGMFPRVDHTPLDAGLLAGGGTVYDLVYNPDVTRLLRDAAAAGCQTIGGLDMLVGQAQEQVRWWTGVRPTGRVMRDAALGRLAQFNAVTEAQTEVHENHVL